MLKKETLLKPNIVCSVFRNELGYDVPLLHSILSMDNHPGKICSLLLDGLFHYNDIILSHKLTDNKEENKKLFLKQYLNFNKLKSPIVSIYTFVKSNIFNFWLVYSAL